MAVLDPAGMKRMVPIVVGVIVSLNMFTSFLSTVTVKEITSMALKDFGDI